MLVSIFEYMRVFSDLRDDEAKESQKFSNKISVIVNKSLIVMDDDITMLWLFVHGLWLRMTQIPIWL